MGPCCRSLWNCRSDEDRVSPCICVCLPLNKGLIPCSTVYVAYSIWAIWHLVISCDLTQLLGLEQICLFILCIGGAQKGSCGKGGNPATSSGAVWPGSSQQKITADEHGTYLEMAPRQYVLLSNSPAEAAASPKGKGKQHAKGKSKVPRGPASSGEAAEKGKGALDQKGSALKGKGKGAKNGASSYHY